MYPKISSREINIAKKIVGELAKLCTNAFVHGLEPKRSFMRKREYLNIPKLKLVHMKKQETGEIYFKFVTHTVLKYLLLK